MLKLRLRFQTETFSLILRLIFSFILQFYFAVLFCSFILQSDFDTDFENSSESRA